MIFAVKKSGAIASAILALSVLTATGAIAADEGWNPFRDRDAVPPKREQRPTDRDRARPADRSSTYEPTPSDNSGLPINSGLNASDRGYTDPASPRLPNDTAVRSKELPPISPPASTPAGKAESWQGMTAETLTAHLRGLKHPSKSWSLRPTWLQLLTNMAAQPEPEMVAALADALFDSGAFRESLRVATSAGPAASVPVKLKAARAQIALGDIDDGCAAIKQAASQPTALSADARAIAIIYAGYCAARSGQPSGATLAAQLAKEAGVDAPQTLTILDRVGAGSPGGADNATGLSLIDVRLLQLLPGALTAGHVSKASLPAVVALAIDPNAPPNLRIAAAEAAAGASALSSDDLNEAYATAEKLRVNDPETDATRRARLWLTIGRERAMYQRTRDIRTFLDSAKRAGHPVAALRLVATVLHQIKRVAEIGWFAETAIEAAIASGKLVVARDWIAFAATLDETPAKRLRHWLALVDMADPQSSRSRGRDLDAVERLARAGRFRERDLHRLATVLDALNYNVPIGLWDTANRAKQPSDGHLPKTGVLRELANASQARQSARTVLLALQTIGPNGAEGAHMLALGDSVRALKRVGLEADARRLAVEAVFTSWPRTGLDQ